MYKDLIDKEILNITRVDESGDYDFYGLFFDVGQELGLYFGTVNGKWITIDLLTRDELNKNIGFEYSECDLHELDQKDELKQLVGQKITEIRIAEYKDSSIKGETFELILGGYAAIRIKTQYNEIVFFNKDGGRLLFNDGNETLVKEPWTWK